MKSYNDKVQSNNSFVKKGQAKQRAMMGDRPGAPKEMKNLDAYMSNTGEKAQACAKAVTKGLSDAFPVK